MFASKPACWCLDITCDFEMVRGHLLVPSIHSTIPGACVTGLQAGHHEAVGGGVQPNPVWVNQWCGSQFWSINCHSGILDCGERRAGSVNIHNDSLKDKTLFVFLSILNFSPISSPFSLNSSCCKGEIWE